MRPMGSWSVEPVDNEVVGRVREQIASGPLEVIQVLARTIQALETGCESCVSFFLCESHSEFFEIPRVPIEVEMVPIETDRELSAGLVLRKLFTLLRVNAGAHLASAPQAVSR